mmetsp:Transcript_21143/g.65539  ORF Transcript_21143/g.65539 Transcript_21143/m.65539 type:complete len:363 (-) Transcript_21143:1061-2149(-)
MVLPPCSGSSQKFLTQPVFLSLACTASRILPLPWPCMMYSVPPPASATELSHRSISAGASEGYRPEPASMSVLPFVCASNFCEASEPAASPPPPASPCRCTSPNAPGVCFLGAPPLPFFMNLPMARTDAASPSRAAFSRARRCLRLRPEKSAALTCLFSSTISPCTTLSIPNALGKSCPNSALSSLAATSTPSGAAAMNSARMRSTSSPPSTVHADALAAVTSFMASVTSSSDSSASRNTASARALPSSPLPSVRMAASLAAQASSAAERAASRATAAASASASTISARSRSTSSSASSGAYSASARRSAASRITVAPPSPAAPFMFSSSRRASSSTSSSRQPNAAATAMALLAPGPPHSSR